MKEKDLFHIIMTTVVIIIIGAAIGLLSNVIIQHNKSEICVDRYNIIAKMRNSISNETIKRSADQTISLAMWDGQIKYFEYDHLVSALRRYMAEDVKSKLPRYER